MRKLVEIKLSENMEKGSDLKHEATLLYLTHDARHVRRRVITLKDGKRVLIDLAEPMVLRHGDMLILDDGSRLLIQAADEDHFEIRAKDPVHLSELAWHIGNRHLAAEIRKEEILILRDHVIRQMLEHLGATVTDKRGPFMPVRGAYSGTANPHNHGHHKDDGYRQDSGESNVALDDRFQENV